VLRPRKEPWRGADRGTRAPSKNAAIPITSNFSTRARSRRNDRAIRTSQNQRRVSQRFSVLPQSRIPEEVLIEFFGPSRRRDQVGSSAKYHRCIGNKARAMAETAKSHPRDQHHLTDRRQHLTWNPRATRSPDAPRERRRRPLAVDAVGGHQVKDLGQE